VVSRQALMPWFTVVVFFSFLQGRMKSGACE
jgi:hypothetical protein